MVITAISIDVCACVITTATFFKVPCISKLRFPPPASSSGLGESFPEEPLWSVHVPEGRKSPLESLLAAGQTALCARPLWLTTVPSGFRFPGSGCRRLRPPPAGPAQQLDAGALPEGPRLSIEDYGEAELGIWRAQW